MNGRVSVVAGALVFCVAMSAVGTAASGTSIRPTGVLSGLFSVLDFGARCDGLTDDTVAFSRAVHAAQPSGIIRIPAATCVVSSSIVLGDDTGLGGTTFLSLEGITPGVSAIQWRGTSDGVAVKMVRNKYFAVKNIAIYNASGQRGTSIGLLQTGYGGVGTETLGGTFEHIIIAGFSVGMQAGQTSGVVAAASDSAYRWIDFEANDVGFRLVEGNSKNHVVTDINCGENGLCVDLVAGSMSVNGGSTNHNDTDFMIRNTDVFSIKNVRAELKSGGTFLKVPAAYVVLVEGCQVGESVSPTTWAVDLDVVRHAIIQGNHFISKVRVNNYVSGAMMMLNNYIHGDEVLPFFLGPDGGTFPVVSKGNIDNGGMDGQFRSYANFEGMSR